MSFITEIRLHRVRAVKTLAIYLVFISYGLTSGMVGPAMLDFGILTNSSISQLSLIFPGRSAGDIIGATLMGFVYPYLNFQLMSFITSAAIVAMHVWLPFSATYLQLIITFFANGIVIGFVGTALNLQIIDLWGKENGPFLQALHFCFGLGSFFAPWVVKPFLLERETSINSNRSIDEVIAVDHFSAQGVQLKYPFWFIAAFHFIPTVIYLLLWKLHPSSNPHPSLVVKQSFEPEEIEHNEEKQVSQDQGTSDKSDNVSKEISNQLYKYLVIGLMMCFMPIYYGVELTFGSYLASFAVKGDLKLSKGAGADVTSLYWAMFTFFRLSTVFYIDLIGAEKNILMNIAMILAGNASLIPLSLGYQSSWCLWLGSALMGTGCSSIYASVFAFLEMYFSVSPKAASFILVSTSIGDFTVPFIMSFFMEDYPNVFVIVTLLFSLIMSFIFVTAVIVCKLKFRKQTVSQTENNLEVVN